MNRIAEILTARGDTDPVGARRARAIGILARPAEALQLLIEHQHDPPSRTIREPTTAEPDPTSPKRAASPSPARPAEPSRAG